MATLSIASRLDRVRLAEIADGLAVAVAVSMPWSTSATSWLYVLDVGIIGSMALKTRAAELAAGAAP